MVNRITLQADIEPFPGYRLCQLLGRGSFGEVWEAEKENGRRLALKFLPCSDSLAPAREIKALQAVQKLRHPNLIRLDDVWCSEGYIVVAMELAEGSLLDMLEVYQNEFHTPIAPEQVCLYLAQAAEGVDFLNTRRHVIDGKRVAIRHCDIKPSNLLLLGNTVKLCDFGLASFASSSLQPHRRAGTLDYMAPEVFQGRISDRTDQYSLAVSYCYLRGGQLPFTDTPSKIRSDYVRPEPDLTMLSAGEKPIIARALARTPQDRWPSCAEMVQELTKLVS